MPRLALDVDPSTPIDLSLTIEQTQALARLTTMFIDFGAFPGDDEAMFFWELYETLVEPLMPYATVVEGEDDEGSS